jgi:flagellar basal-body rod protein FlgF
MDHALLVGLSRQTALRRELDVVSNNIANVNTTGYKADGAVFSEYLDSGAQAGQFGVQDRRLSFTQDTASWTDMSAGPLQRTGNALDVAIEGNGFLVVQTPQGERYTRNGAMQINAQGELVTSVGHRVLGDSGPIVFNTNDRDITINPDGSIRVREGINPADASRGKLRLATFSDQRRLRKEGSSLFVAPDTMQPQPSTDARVVQGALEKSNVRSVLEMSRMIEVTRSYTEVANILQRHGDMRQSAISRLADVPNA